MHLAVSLRCSHFKIHEIAVKAEKGSKLYELGRNLPGWNDAGIIDASIWLEDGPETKRAVAMRGICHGRIRDYPRPTPVHQNIVVCHHPGDIHPLFRRQA